MITAGTVIRYAGPLRSLINHPHMKALIAGIAKPTKRGRPTRAATRAAAPATPAIDPGTTALDTISVILLYNVGDVLF